MALRSGVYVVHINAVQAPQPSNRELGLGGRETEHVSSPRFADGHTFRLQRLQTGAVLLPTGQRTITTTQIPAPISGKPKNRGLETVFG